MEDFTSTLDSLTNSATDIFSLIKGPKAPKAPAAPTGGVPKWILPAGIGAAVLVVVLLLINRGK